jgi:DNA recombination protein RmuC
MLEKVQKNLETAGSQLDEVIGKRTRAIERKLRGVQELPAEQSANILAIGDDMQDEDIE